MIIFGLHNYQFSMKKIIYFSCCFFLISCKKENTPSIDYRQEMRYFVQEISQYAKSRQPGFIIIPQNGHQLLTADGISTGTLSSEYIQAIDGIGREDLFYGYENDNVATSAGAVEETLPFMNTAKENGITVLAIDYCSDESKMNDSYTQSAQRGYISFAADHRELDNIPSFPATPFNADTNSIHTLVDARNFLYLINTSLFESKERFISAVSATNYDVIVMDINFNETFFTRSEINALKHKANGGLRKVVCYMSIGEAEDYRYYWQPVWSGVSPSWMVAENAQWAGNYKVKYWEKEWQHIIYGNDNSYTAKILDAGFDGAYLDIIDGFEYFEN
jgi:cysteinyl-tRNA synthetase, unknown class